MQIGGAEEVQRNCRGAEVQRCREIGDVQRSRNGAEV
jgi:hypothetical protein